MREYEFAGIEPCAHGDHGWFVLAPAALAPGGTREEVRIPLSAGAAREIVSADPRLRAPAELLADAMRNSLRVLAAKPIAVDLAVRKHAGRVVISARLRGAASPDVPLSCFAALLVGLRWELPFWVSLDQPGPGTGDEDASGDSLAVYRAAVDAIDFSGLGAGGDAPDDRPCGRPGRT